MSLNEFRYKFILINKFIEKLNAEDIPGNIKPIILKVYAGSLKIHISDKMACEMIKASYAS